MLQANQRSLRDYPSMSYPENGNLATYLNNSLILVELNYNNEDLKLEFLPLFSQMTGLLTTSQTFKPPNFALLIFLFQI